jgi:hypothetical protein
MLFTGCSHIAEVKSGPPECNVYRLLFLINLLPHPTLKCKREEEETKKY